MSSTSHRASSQAHTLRVNQLDARMLDAEFSSLMRQQLNEIFVFMRPGLLQQVQPELDALFQAMLWRHTIWADKPTPGGALQNVVYARADSRGSTPSKLLRLQKIMFLGINVILPWLGQRLMQVAEGMDTSGMSDEEGSLQRSCRACARWCLRSLVPRLTAIHAVCAALNFVVFLRHGAFSTLSDRLLKVRLVHLDPTAHRQNSFQYMTRVMMWNGLSEFLMIVVPLINLARVRQVVQRRLVPKAVIEAMHDASEAAGENQCAICGASPMTLPMRANCGHVFCYFCIASEQMERPDSATCPRCNIPIKSYRHSC